MPDRDLAADLGVAEALRARTRGIGSLSMVARMAVATTVSYVVALRFSQSVLPVFAPATTLLVVQSSAFSTLGMVGQRVLGTGLGVAAATLYVTYVPIAWWSVLAAVTASLLVARALPLGLVGQLQLPVAVVFVLALGPGDLSTDLWRVVDVVIGGVIGVVAVFIAPPRPRLADADAALDRYLSDIADLLRRIAAEIGTHAAPLPPTTRHAFVGDARSLLGHVATVSDAMAEAAESVRFNPRARALRGRLAVIAQRRQWATAMATQARTLAGSADRLYDREGHAPACTAPTLRSLLVDLAELIAAVDREGAGPATAELDLALGERLRAAVSATAQERDVVDVLDSVTVLGRLDGLRTLVAHGPSVEDPLGQVRADGTESDGAGGDAEDLLGPGERVRRLLRRD